MKSEVDKKRVIMSSWFLSRYRSSSAFDKAGPISSLLEYSFKMTNSVSKSTEFLAIGSYLRDDPDFLNDLQPSL